MSKVFAFFFEKFKRQLYTKQVLSVAVFGIVFVAEGLYGAVYNKKEFVLSEFLQEKIQIKGQVVSEDGMPLLGVSVVVKGTAIGVVTDFDGNFSLEVSSEIEVVLVFSYIGLLTQEITYKGATEMKVTLLDDSVGLDEVVVVGYGTQKKSHLIGAISKIAGKNIAELPVSGVDEALRGRVAGLQVRNTSSEVGEAQEIVIRGASSINATNSPLIVIDGITIPGLDISAVDSDDIESVEVLKDAASTAIYGSRGASGVIIITTKSGKSGKKTSYSLRIQNGVKTPIYSYDIYNQFQSVDEKLLREQSSWETPFLELGLSPTANFDANNKPLPNPSGVLYPTRESYLNGSTGERMRTMIAMESGGHDWLDEMTRDYSQFKKYSLTVQGGSDKTRFYVSGVYQENEGLMKDNNYERLYLRFKVDSKLARNIDFGINITPQFISSEKTTATFNQAISYDNFMPIYHNAFTSFLTNNTIDIGEYTRSSHFGDGTPVLSWDQYEAWKNGELTSLPSDNPTARLSSSSATNPISKQNERSNTTNEFRILSSVYLTWKINSKLQFKTTASHYYTNKINNVTESEKYSRNAIRSAMNYNQTVQRFINENTVNYTTSFEDHGLSVLAGFTDEITNYKYARIEGTNIPLGLPLTVNNATLISQDNADTFAQSEKEVLISGLFRVNYDYKEKYLFSASVRADGSSIFANGNRWGYFPSLSVGWRMSEESFIQPIQWLSNLKVRTSFGATGNNSIARYSYLDEMTARNYSDASGSVLSGLGLENITKGNPEITWEKTNQFNYGLDIGVFRNRIGVTIEYYYTLTDDLLLQRTLPLSTGFENVWENVGKINNQGLEIQLTSTNINTENFRWKMNFNYAHNKNKLIDFGGQYQMFSYGRRQNEYLMQVGLQPSNMYGWKTDGVFNSLEELNSSPSSQIDVVGSLKRVDLDGDGVITENDKTIIGNPIPKFNWGFGHDFKYKNWDASLLFDGSHDFDIINLDFYNPSMRDNISDHFDGMYLDEFHGTKPIDRGGVNWEHTDYIVYDGSFVALRSISLGYTIPKILMNNMGLGSGRVYFTGLNLVHHIYGDYKGINPEFKDRNHNTVLKGGEQSSTLPLERSFVLGIDIKF